MAKTLVAAQHEHGPLQNGADGCHARFGNDGMCPGVKTAEWLNGLGDDAEYFIKPTPRCPGTTNGQVRVNWLRESAHVVALEPARVQLVSTINRLSAELRRAKRELKRLEK